MAVTKKKFFAFLFYLSLGLLLVVWAYDALVPSLTAYEKAQVAHHAEPPLGQTAVRHYDAVIAEENDDRRPRKSQTEALYQKAIILDHGILQGPEPVLPNPASAIGFYRQVAVLGSPREQALARDRLIELEDRVLFNPPPRRQHILTTQREHLAAGAAAAADIVELRAQDLGRSNLPTDGPRSDSQNVHDSSVVKSVKTALDRLDPSPTSLENTLIEVRQAMSTDEHALKGLDLMEKNTLPLTALKTTEVEVLRKVWGRIQGETQEEKRKDMVQMLKTRLQECGKDASCASGRVARVVDSLSTFDDCVNIRPLWALRQEMLAKASLLRQQQPGPDDAPKLVDRLRIQFTKDYVDTGLMTPTLLEGELASWGELD